MRSYSNIGARSSGESKLGCVFWILLVGLCTVIGYQLIPTQIAVMQLEDHMEELAMTQPRKSAPYFEREIHLKARQLGLEIPRKNIKVKKYPERVIMKTELVKEISVLGVKFDWDFSIEVDRNIFLL